MERHQERSRTEEGPSEDTEKTAMYLQAKDRDLGRTQTCQHLDLRLPASRTVSK